MPKSGFFLSQLHIVQDLGFSSKIRRVLTRSLKMTTTQVVEMSVTVNNNIPIQDYIHPDDHTQPTHEMTPGLKPFTRSENWLDIRDLWI